METNEALRKTLFSLAETGMETLVQSLQGGKDGNLQALEQQVLVQILALGRSCLEQIVEHQAKQEGSAARREGKCGHYQRLVGIRPRQVLTLLGPMTIHRAYYQCLRTDEQREDQQTRTCSHGEAPFDEHWGLCGQRSSPGVQKVVSYLSAHLTQEGVAEAVCRLLPLHISARQVGNVSQPIGEAFEQWEDEQVRDLLQRGANEPAKTSGTWSRDIL